ncbi:hypothetical protein NQ176_g7377 [Zarea fungicola]|uniref:Uncharacterized protein n=1 Tax=Zarea fungicola TaxID=93591 RepID=A0ACC1N0P1_9HYPO|nr:hypothetical protein NQ176_g7377 [Lecanicillium fungicola]
MSVERKYDGEYCQVHIKLEASGANIQIFSKSGRDSTSDRAGVHQAVRDSLRLGMTGCRITKQCILEGELVWNDDVGRIEPFHKIRRHVHRAGRYIGTARDSPIARSEHLMIIFYDIMLLDDAFCARQSQDKRRHLLERLIQRIPGRADVGFRQVIQFSSIDAAEGLRQAFASAIAQRWEGLVLKGCHDPYPSFGGDRASIKLKKDYIPGLGDTADFALLGGRHDVRETHGLGIGKVRWTAFYIGCLDNKKEVCHFAAKPKFRIIDMIDRHGIRKQDFIFLNRHGYFSQVPFDQSLSEYDIIPDSIRRLHPSTLFRIPFIVEMVGAGFDRPANAAYYTLRFPRMLKIHADRSLKDTIGFVELQEMAKTCIAAPADREWEEKAWYCRLRGQQRQE